jgi:predicted TIM-barrel fold metal-dependent hydrolase
LRETLTRVLRSYRSTRGEPAAGLLSLPSTSARKADCDFDAEAWDRGGSLALAAAGIGRVVLSRLPAAAAPSLLPPAEGSEPAWRAVVAAPNDTSKAALAALDAFGVRGIRVDLGAATSDGLDPLLRLADRIVPFGWHIEIRMAAPGAARALSKAELRLMQFPLAVCFSGIGRFGQGGSADDGIDFLLGMVKLGRYWLKLSCSDLAAPQLKLWDEPAPLARALQGVRKDRLIWGSGKQPEGGHATHLASGLAALERCLPHPGDQEQVLVENPARLYGFDDR